MQPSFNTTYYIIARLTQQCTQKMNGTCLQIAMKCNSSEKGLADKGQHPLSCICSLTEAGTTEYIQHRFTYAAWDEPDGPQSLSQNGPAAA